MTQSGRRKAGSEATQWLASGGFAGESSFFMAVTLRRSRAFAAIIMHG